jgi:hypothetical protein
MDVEDSYYKLFKMVSVVSGLRRVFSWVNNLIQQKNSATTTNFSVDKRIQRKKK